MSADERKPGESFCSDCPDHEACATAWPCDVVKATNAPKWAVHVQGPDDVLPATGRLDAMVQAQQINATSLDLLAASNDDPMYPFVWATPIREGL